MLLQTLPAEVAFVFFFSAKSWWISLRHPLNIHGGYVVIYLYFDATDPQWRKMMGKAAGATQVFCWPCAMRFRTMVIAFESKLVRIPTAKFLNSLTSTLLWVLSCIRYVRSSYENPKPSSSIGSTQFWEPRWNKCHLITITTVPRSLLLPMQTL